MELTLEILDEFSGGTAVRVDRNFSELVGGRITGIQRRGSLFVIDVELSFKIFNCAPIKVPFPVFPKNCRYFVLDDCLYIIQREPTAAFVLTPKRKIN